MDQISSLIVSDTFINAHVQFASDSRTCFADLF